MRRTREFVLLLLLFSLATLGLAARGGSFDQPNAWQLDNGGASGGSFAPATAPDGTPTGKWAWGAHHQAWQELHAAQPLAVPAFAEACHGTIAVRVYSDGTTAVRQISLRLIDAQGEIFQLVQPVSLAKPGWQDLVYHVQPDAAYESWGGTVNHTFDLPVRVEGFVVSFAAADTASGALYFDDITCAADGIRAITFDVDTGTPIHVLRVGEEKQLAMRVQNTARTAQQVRIALTLENIDRETMTLTRACTVPAQGSVAWRVPAPKKLGLWWVHYTITDARSGEQASGRRSFCYMRPAGPTPERANGFLFGIAGITECCHRPDGDWEMLAAALCGAKVMRIGPEWAALQSADGNWHWEQFDWLVNECDRLGMELEYKFEFTPSWFVADQTAIPLGWEYTKTKSPRLDAWRRYCAAVATRYHDKLRLYEVWNEPDLGFWGDGLDAYLQLLHATREEVRRANPRALVMNGGLANVELDAPSAKPRFVEDMITRGQDDMDIFAVHLHGSFTYFQRSVDGELVTLRKLFDGEKPLYFNETGIPSVEDTQQMQAETLVKKLVFAWARGAMGYTWFSIRDTGDNPRDLEQNFGMLTHDFHPKIVYPTYNTLALALRGKRYLGELKLGPDRWGFIFGDAREEVVVSWSEIGWASEESYVLQTNAKSAAWMDLMGNRTPAPVVGGRVVLPVANTPKYLVLRTAHGLPTLRQQLVAIPEVPPGIPGRTVAVTAAFSNPFGTAQTVTVDWHTADGPGNPLRQSVRIPANGTGTATLPLTIPRDGTAQYGDTRVVHLSYRFSATGWHGALRIPVPLAACIPAGDAATRPADFTMADRAHIHNLRENDPNVARLTWQGPQDVSARVWLGRDHDALTLRVVVQDDVFRQPFTGGGVWAGDNIQFALVVPGQDGYWECGLTRLADGTPSVYTWGKPAGFADPAGQVALQTTLTPGELTYTASLPYAAFGLTDSTLERGIKFNLIVNDCDEDAREGWAFIAGGIGENKDPSLFPFVVFAQP